MSYSPSIARIIETAKADGIDLAALPFAAAAFGSIDSILTPADSTLPQFEGATRIDTHVHAVPGWYRTLAPTAAGNPTPKWDVQSHLRFMADNRIAHSMLCVSTPQANLFPGEEKTTVAVARLLNEFMAALVRTYPLRFSFQAVTPLPYTDAAIREVLYALDHLGAVGTGVLTNHEGKYLGNQEFQPLFQVLQDRDSSREVLFIHPTDPVINVDGALIPSNPAPYRTGLGEYYFETARAISDLTASKTLQNFPKLHYRIAHGGGAWPSIEERFLLGFPDIQAAAREIYATRFWYDSAGPVYPRQIRGLLAYGVPITQLVFGTDYPYGATFWDAKANIAALEDAEFLSEEDKQGIFRDNARALFAGNVPRF
ncbi:hypothetical protein GP486_000875 [Trichoglossum hirsutum]|uniref:Amidohydrolase-related domain-containing protein n=1 Tax=Trichoglossum hirsutum TaxID=265104 RepID=A0A9P8LI47_9PEZI|nr:hypothetical protein GP486_000875 [Trichoglossum hirsutum]